MGREEDENASSSAVRDLSLVGYLGAENDESKNPVIQPSLIHDGEWLELKDGDESCRTIFNRHYSRRVYTDGRKPKQFVGPGTKKVLMLADGRALFAWRKHISDDGQTGVNCAIFRHEGSEHFASELIRDAVRIARERWWPDERFYTYIDPRKVRPTMCHSHPIWGWCFYKAGWKFVTVGKGGKHVLALESASSINAVDPVDGRVAPGSRARKGSADV